MTTIIRTDIDILSSRLNMDGTFLDPSVTTTICRNNGQNTQSQRTMPGRIDHFLGLHIHMVNSNSTFASSAIVLSYPPTNRFHISVVQL